MSTTEHPRAKLASTEDLTTTVRHMQGTVGDIANLTADAPRLTNTTRPLTWDDNLTHVDVGGPPRNHGRRGTRNRRRRGEVGAEETEGSLEGGRAAQGRDRGQGRGH